MEEWQCCRTCLSVQSLNPIFAMSEHSEKYSEVILAVTGVKVALNDTLSQYICSICVAFINQAYKFRLKCENAQKCLQERLQYNNLYKIKIEQGILNPENGNSIDISELLDDFDDYDDNITLNEINTSNPPAELEKTENSDNILEITKDKVKKRVRKKDEREKKKERAKEEIECELCHKVLTSRLSLRNHYKIHSGFDVVCEHCGKKFITRRLLLMHCKAKHGYEKTDKCSFCDYRASNAEQVKIHERLHTGEKPYVCKECAAGFHRRSSYLQHVAIHLPDKTVQCEKCPARFKSVTLMRIHMNRHRAPAHTFRCRLCDNRFVRRRNVARHLQRIHAINGTECTDRYIERNNV